jgi:hypothetical protein
MRVRAWFLIAGVVAGASVACIGCPSDPDPIHHDSGVCVAYDFGIDETEAGTDAEAAADAIDADETAGDTADANDSTSVETDAGSDTAVDAADAADAIDATDSTDATDAVTDAAEASDASDASDGETIASNAPKVCRSDVETIFFLTCSLPSCHGRFPDGQSGLYIGTTGDWTQNVVNVTSKERKDLKRVVPGDLKNSWLAHKLVGDQCLFGSKCVDGDCGDQMPGTGQPLDPSDLNTVLEWIRQGADTTADCSGGTK